MPMRREQVAAALKYLGDKADLRGRFERATSLDPQEQDLADIAVETAAGFVPGVGQALAARDVERARRANDPTGMAMASMGAVPGGRLAGLLKRYDPVMQQLDVYHGTPHRFPATEANPLGEFDASKIGTGEGAQAYGHGIYYAESPTVAKNYATAGVKDEEGAAAHYLKIYKDPERAAQSILEEHPKDRVTERSRLFAEKTAEILRSGKTPTGNLYKADLPDEMIDRMLDWDKPLSEQPAAVRESLRKLGKEHPLMFGPPDKLWKFRDAINDPNLTGAQIHKQFEDLFGSQKVSGALMRQAGIPGIRYLDAGSRGQGGSGTRNFVVFPGEEKKVRILERK